MPYALSTLGRRSMRLLHTSDWYLGRVLHERSLLEDQAAFPAQLIELLGRDPHDALLIAGDIFDRGIAPEDAVLCFSHFLRDLRTTCPSLPVIVIAC
jgi:DNA repair protein SbcD/Mre11